MKEVDVIFEKMYQEQMYLDLLKKIKAYNEERVFQEFLQELRRSVQQCATEGIFQLPSTYLSVIEFQLMIFRSSVAYQEALMNVLVVLTGKVGEEEKEIAGMHACMFLEFKERVMHNAVSGDADDKQVLRLIEVMKMDKIEICNFSSLGEVLAVNPSIILLNLFL